jgi:site-specific recombinase XerD
MRFPGCSCQKAAAAYASIRELPDRDGSKTGGPGACPPHMLRHSCGCYLANRGYDLRVIQDYLGHRDPEHTVHYTRVGGRRFEGLWQ